MQANGNPGWPASLLSSGWSGKLSLIMPQVGGGFRRGTFRLLLAVVLVGLLSLPTPELWARGKKQSKTPEQFSSLNFVVLRASSGKPVRNASVVIRFLGKDGRENGEGLQLKTDGDGLATIQDIPFGKLRLQVVAPRLQTYGEDVEIDSPQQEFVIRLNPPSDQFSIYK